MPFVKGNQLGKGRPAGQLNRSTEQAKLAVARLANSGLDALREDLEKIRKEEPLEAAKIYLKLLEYIVPKKAAVELTGQIDQRIQQISINITKSGSGELRD
jgi:hypothetical protein